MTRCRDRPDPPECSRCGCRPLRWYARLRADPSDYLELGPSYWEPPADWWGEARRWWDVGDAPDPSLWTEPARADLARAGSELLCQWCDGRAFAPKDDPSQPSLFDDPEVTRET